MSKFRNEVAYYYDMHGGDMAMSESPDYRYQNERLLLKAIKEQLKITDEEMHSPHAVKAKIRDAKIDIVLE